MSELVAKIENNKLIIEKKRARQTNQDIEIIQLEQLENDKHYKSKVVLSSIEQANQIILSEQTSYTFIDEKMETRNIYIVVYTQGKKVYYFLGDIRKVYKKLVKVPFKITGLSLNSKRFSINMYAYVINKYNLNITNKMFVVNEFIKKDIKLTEHIIKMSKFKLLFSKNKFNVKVSKNELLKEEVPINNGLKIVLEINGEEIEYKVAIKNKKIRNSKYYYTPIKTQYIGDFAFHIRRSLNGKLVLVKRLKEPIEDTLRFKLLENKFVSIILYFLGQVGKKLRTKNVNIYYEKFCSKIEEGAYDIYAKCKNSKTSKNYFILSKDSDDFERVKNDKNVIKQYSFKYYWLIYNANYAIATEAQSHLNVLRSNNRWLRKATYNIKFIFLQHGITYLKSHSMNSTFVTGKEGEQEYIVVGSEKEQNIVSDMFKIDEDKILVTGLPIFSNLKYKHINQDSDDFITIMLTWKPYEEYIYNFEESTYYEYIIDIYNILSKYIDKEKIAIVAHPKVYDLLESTDMKDSIWQGKISEILEKTKMLITDYSSVCYNSFYQGAGVVFYQPDLEMYQTYNGELIPTDDEYIGKRAFDIQQLETIVKETIVNKKINLSKIRNKEFEEKYSTINEFSDGKNIDRIYEKLKELNII